MQTVTTKAVKSLKDFGTSAADGMTSGRRTWELFDPKGQEAYKQASVEKPFAREVVHQAYVKAVSDSKQTGTQDAMVAKMECGLLSSLQKGAVLRARGRILSFALAASRRSAQADSLVEIRLERPIAALEGRTA